VVKRALPPASWVNSQLAATALSDHPGLGYRGPAGIRRRR
jgi:hypothetical protein